MINWIYFLSYLLIGFLLSDWFFIYAVSKNIKEMDMHNLYELMDVYFTYCAKLIMSIFWPIILIWYVGLCFKDYFNDR